MTALHRKRDLCDFRIKVTLSTQKSLTRKNLQYTTKKNQRKIKMPLTSNLEKIVKSLTIFSVFDTKYESTEWIKM